MMGKKLSHWELRNVKKIAQASQAREAVLLLWSARIESNLKRAQEVLFKENSLFCGCIDTLDNKHQRGHRFISGHLILSGETQGN